MKCILIFATLFNYTNALWAGPTKVGNGDDGSDLEGFDLVTSGPLVQSKIEAISLLTKLNTSGIIGLGNLLPEISNEKIYLTKKDVSSKQLEELGAFHSGMEGLVYARTFPRPYAPVRFFPASVKLSQNQLMALHIHEALHRSLPEKRREDEKIVTKITLSLISPDQTSDSIQEVVKESMPEIFPRLGVIEIDINRNSKLKNPSTLNFSYSKWASTKRKNAAGITLPFDHTYNLDAQFYPFGELKNATGFGVKTSYLMTKKDENYFGPLELTARNLSWTDKGYDFEFKIGYQMMSDSNSKVVDSLYGHNAFIFGVEAKRVQDEYKLNFGVDLIGSGTITRALNNQNTRAKIGSLANIKANILLPWRNFEYGASATLHALSSLKIDQNGFIILDKQSDEYFSAGPELSYKYNQTYSLKLEGDYLFNSNKNPTEDNIRDLFGNGLGQWKWTLGITAIF